MAIQLLDKKVINQISAGEVVEKPASVVKELIENSIDAGATEVTISIKNGGLDNITIMDNGCGIAKNEVKLAFTPHATSKLVEIEDLNSLSTMGFRGEALATISAVSKVNLTTKTESEDVGVMVKLEGGEEQETQEIACVKGTKIEVNNLFFNTPARLKFLRKPKQEERDITNYVEKLILSNNNVAFKYLIDGKLIYNTINGSLLDNIYTIYGKEVASNLLDVNFNINGYNISGYISKPENAKANRTYQNLFVNGRFCSNSLISSAVSNAFENFAMKGKYPLFVLFINLPQNELDVNVHPNKLEVKFVDTRKIYQLVYCGVFEALSNFNHTRVIQTPNNENNESDFSSLIKNSEINEVNSFEGVSDGGLSSNKYEENYKKLQEYYDSFRKAQNEKTNLEFNSSSMVLENTIPEKELTLESLEIDLSGYSLESNNSNNVISQPNNKTTVQEDFKDILKYEYKKIGKVFNTYLILEYKDSVYFIDQHAAHERHKYDELVQAIESNELIIQDLMIPYVLIVSQAESNFIADNIETLSSFGINISEFGQNTYKVYSVPLLISEINLKDFFDDILENISAFVKSPKDVIKPKLMQMACKSAVKGGDDLSDKEINYLIDKLKNDTEVLLCPHGRPIVVNIDKKQIEKWFKRIV